MWNVRMSVHAASNIRRRGSLTLADLSMSVAQNASGLPSEGLYHQFPGQTKAGETTGTTLVKQD